MAKTDTFLRLIKAKGVNLDVAVDMLSDEWFVGNQLLTNPLSNAIKFTFWGGSEKLSVSNPAEKTNNNFI